ncbi:MAG: hypothetical protein ACI8W8_001769 [Rhodothermales bacterium]|jgi:hypothetical protein
MPTDLALCPLCDEGFHVSESLDVAAIDPEMLRSPPKGADVGERRYRSNHQCGILLEGKTRLRFGTGLNDACRFFVLNVLRLLRAEAGFNAR